MTIIKEPQIITLREYKTNAQMTYSGDRDYEKNKRFEVLAYIRTPLHPDNIREEKKDLRIIPGNKKGRGITEIIVTLEKLVNGEEYQVLLLTNPNFHTRPILFNSEEAIRAEKIKPGNRREEAYIIYDNLDHIIRNKEFTLEVTYENNELSPIRLKLENNLRRQK